MRDEDVTVALTLDESVPGVIIKFGGSFAAVLPAEVALELAGKLTLTATAADRAKEDVALVVARGGSATEIAAIFRRVLGSPTLAA